MIQAAIIGVGYWGPNLLRNLVDHPEIKVKWVCDSNSARLNQMAWRHSSINTTMRFQDVINDPTVDLVAIATPVHTHFDLAIAALHAGKHVLLTKPMASSEQDCLRLIELAARKQRVLMVDHTFVYHPAIAHLKTMVEKGELGELLYFQSSRMNLGIYQPDVSVILDLMPHDLSILNELILEDPIEISVQAKFAARLPQADIAYLSLNYQSNFIASVQASWLSPSKIRQTILTGRKKMAVYDDTNVVEKIKIYDKGIEHLQLADREDCYTKFLQYRQGDVNSPAIPATEALKIEIEHLVECIQSQRTPRTDGYQGMRVVRLLEQADRLAQNNRCWVALKPTTSSPEKSDSAAKSLAA